MVGAFAALDEVQGGKLDYEALFAKHDLSTSLDAIAHTKLPSNHDEAYAFLLNAYNVLTIANVHRLLTKDGKVQGSLRNPFTWVRFFFLSRFQILGRKQSLSTFERKVIGPYLRADPRGHFALVCASQGCPPLRQGIYHGESLDAELELSSRLYLQSPTGFRWDEATRTLHLTKILKWYRRDFETYGSPLDVFQKYGPDDVVEATRKGPLRLRFLRYDWSLNQVE